LLAALWRRTAGPLPTDRRLGPPAARSWRAAGLLVAGLALVAGSLAGCGRNSGTSSSNDPPRAAKDAARPADAKGFASQGGAAQGETAKDASSQTNLAQGGGAATGNHALVPATQRSIIYTGSITVRVSDVNGTAVRLTGIAAGTGGFVGGDQRQMDAGRSTATLTLRIPAARFTAALDEIGHLGDEKSRQVSTQDVTDTVVDLAARIKSQQASVDRIRVLLAKAQSVTEIASVEGELSRRESELESLQAKQRSLDDLSALSTISVTLLGPDAATPATPKPQTGFVAGLRNGWEAFVNSIDVVLTVLGAVLPFAIVFGVPVGLVIWWARRRRRQRSGPIGESGPAGSPAVAGPTG
jgi:hypothetical protein